MEQMNTQSLATPENDNVTKHEVENSGNCEENSGNNSDSGEFYNEDDLNAEKDTREWYHVDISKLSREAKKIYWTIIWFIEDSWSSSDERWDNDRKYFADFRYLYELKEKQIECLLKYQNVNELDRLFWLLEVLDKGNIRTVDPRDPRDGYNNPDYILQSFIFAYNNEILFIKFRPKD